MPYPNLELLRASGFDGRVLRSYHAQLYLRKNLGEVHRSVYDSARLQVSPPGVFTCLQETLDKAPLVLAEFELVSDSPPTDILSARLWAEYWGTRVIAFRPFVRQILDYNAKRTGTTGSDMADADDINPQIIKYAADGIRAVVESARAFHGLGDKRFVVTNVFGTAHA